MKKILLIISCLLAFSIAFGSNLADVYIEEEDIVSADSLFMQSFATEYERLKQVTEAELTDVIIKFYWGDTLPVKARYYASLFAFLYRDDLSEDINEGVFDYLYRSLELNGKDFHKLSCCFSALPTDEAFKIKRRMLIELIVQEGFEHETSSSPANFENADSLRIYYKRLVRQNPNIKKVFPKLIINGISW
jgi:hypothetical protein